MTEKSIYRDPTVPNNNFPADDVPLQVNCTGSSHFEPPLYVHDIRCDYYLICVRRGTLTVETPFPKNTAITAPGLIIFDRNTPFVYRTDTVLEYNWVHFSGNMAKTLLNTCCLAPNRVYPLRDVSLLDGQFQMLFDSFLLRDPLFDVDSCQHLLSLLVTLGRAAKDVENETRDSAWQLKIALKYIHQHYTEDISVHALAAEQYMSISRFRALFHSTMRMSPQEYILSLRITRAAEYLRKTGMSVTEIADAVGYADPHYFSRLFRKKTGKSPREFRQNQTETKQNTDTAIREAENI